MWSLIVTLTLVSNGGYAGSYFIDGFDSQMECALQRTKVTEHYFVKDNGQLTKAVGDCVRLHDA